jgi:hypothetical protein
MGGSIFEVDGGRQLDRLVMYAAAGIPAALPQHAWIAVLTAMKPGLDTRPVLSADAPEHLTEYIQNRAPRLARSSVCRLAG